MENGLTRGEIVRIVRRYIGVDGGYLRDFSYQTHRDFYPEYCDLDIDPFAFLPEGTTRERFEVVLEGVKPAWQAKIIRGLLVKCAVGSSDLRTEEAYAEVVALTERLERGGQVAAAPPVYTSGVVIRALDDAQALLDGGGATSAVDRVHTALHGHLRYLCDEAGITFDREDTMTVLFKTLRKEHPRLDDLGPRGDDIQRVMYAAANILDALNPVRNNATLAHPNEELLGPEEAQLVINVGRSLLTYLDAKVGPPLPVAAADADDDGLDENGDIRF